MIDARSPPADLMGDGAQMVTDAHSPSADLTGDRAQMVIDAHSPPADLMEDGAQVVTDARPPPAVLPSTRSVAEGMVTPLLINIYRHFSLGIY